MFTRSALFLALAAAASTAAASAWPMRDISTRLSFNEPLLHDLGLHLRAVSRPNRRFAAHRLALRFERSLTFAARDDKHTHADIEAQVFEHLLGPGITHRGGFDLDWKNGRLSLQDFVLAPAYEPRTFELRSRDGFVAFRADYAHFDVDADAGRLKLFNLDLRIARDLALSLNAPELTDMVVGTLELDARLIVPAGLAKQEAAQSCSDWSGEQDVALINIGSVGPWGRGNGLVAISPSATLKNVGTANVPWYGKFTGPRPPYNNDQHPFLAWGVYRLANGRFEQIGISDVKHAFYATNLNCAVGACTGLPGETGSILGLGCEDTYSQSNNQQTSALSFRNEIQSASGFWNHTGSHFDQNGDGVQDHFGSGETFLDHGATVLESDLATAGATYYLDAWYLVRDDINIFNTMGWRQITPAFNGSVWTFALASAFSNGPAVNVWINDAAPAPGRMNTVLTRPDGHLRVAVETTDLGGGLTRYEYALINHDFDRRIGSFFIPTGGNTVTDLYFHDVDRDAISDWTATQNADGVTWSKPVAAAGLGWGTLYNFGFTATTAPSEVVATLDAVATGDPAQLTIATLAPVALFANGFE